MGIGGTLCQALAKRVMRAPGGKVKMLCVNLQLCTGVEAVKEGVTHAVAERRLEREKQRQSKE